MLSIRSEFRCQSSGRPPDASTARLQQLVAATQAAWATRDPAAALANATPYLQAFGHVVLAWVWLDVALASLRIADAPLAQGKRAACRYFFRYELPKIAAWLGVVSSRDATCAELAEASL